MADRSNKRRIGFSDISDSIQVDKNALTIAFYRQYLFSNNISIKVLVESIKLGVQEARVTPIRIDLNKVFQQQFLMLDANTQQICEKFLEYLIRKQHKSYSNVKGTKFASKTNQHIMLEVMMCELQALLQVNSDYSSIQGTTQKLFEEEELLRLFDCSPQILAHIQETYQQNKINIIHPKNSSIICCQLVVFKLKRIISKMIQSVSVQQLPKEQEIMKTQIYIKQYYNNKSRRQQESQQIKQSLFQFCDKYAYLCDIKYEKKQQLRAQLKQLATCLIPEELILLQIKRISLKYKVKQHLVQYQLARIRKGSKVRMQKRQQSYQKALQFFNYYRIRYRLQNTEIWNTLAKQKSIKSIQSIRYNFSEQIKRIFKQEEQNYIKSCQRLILDKIVKRNIVFVDFFQIYRTQLILNNLLSKNNIPRGYAINKFNPYDDAIYHSIIGITTKQVLFVESTTKKLNFSNYFLQLGYIIDKHKEKMPKTIALYIPLGFQGSQWQKLDKFNNQIRKVGKRLLLLPSNIQIPNPIRQIEYYLKHMLLKDLSHKINEDNFELNLGQFVKDSLIQINKKGRVRQLINYLWNI